MTTTVWKTEFHTKAGIGTLYQTPAHANKHVTTFGKRSLYVLNHTRKELFSKEADATAKKTNSVAQAVCFGVGRFFAALITSAIGNGVGILYHFCGIFAGEVLGEQERWRHAALIIASVGHLLCSPLHAIRFACNPDKYQYEPVGTIMKFDTEEKAESYLKANERRITKVQRPPYEFTPSDPSPREERQIDDPAYRESIPSHLFNDLANNQPPWNCS